MIANKWANAWIEAGKEPLPMPYQSMVAGPVRAAAIRDKRMDVLPGFAGQGIGLIKSVRPAAEVMRDLVSDAEEALAGAKRLGRRGRGNMASEAKMQGLDLKRRIRPVEAFSAMKGLLRDKEATAQVFRIDEAVAGNSKYHPKQA